jgi:tRNA pseudouridine55 synthase
MIGFINLNKPATWTSHDCVAKVRKLLKIKQVGHGGTLDPAATGVLPIAVGKATRLLPYLPERKAYRARIRFGVTTTTDDLEGEIRQTRSGKAISLDEVQFHLTQSIGKIEQIPPMYSAIRRDGQRMYELARKGEVVELPSRTVEIYSLDRLNWYPGESPEIEVAIACSPGTYIRSIARDLGDALGVGGTLAQLIRTESGGMHLADSVTLEELETQNNLGLISPLLALSHLEAIYLASDEARRWCNGQAVAIAAGATNEQAFTILTQEQQFLGIGIIHTDHDRQLLKPKVVLA